MSLFHDSSGMKQLMRRELKYLSKKGIISEASSLTKIAFKENDFEWYSPGIRSQLYDLKEKRLVMDFKSEQLENTIHLLNSVSPSWTCAFITAKMVANQLLELSSR